MPGCTGQAPSDCLPEEGTKTHRMVRSAGEESPWKLILNFRLWSSPSPCTGASGHMKTIQFQIQGLSPRSVPSTEHLIYCLEECLPTQRGHPSHAQTHMSVGVTLRTVEGDMAQSERLGRVHTCWGPSAHGALASLGPDSGSKTDHF